MEAEPSGELSQPYATQATSSGSSGAALPLAKRTKAGVGLTRPPRQAPRKERLPPPELPDPEASAPSVPQPPSAPSTPPTGPKPAAAEAKPAALGSVVAQRLAVAEAEAERLRKRRRQEE